MTAALIRALWKPLAGLLLAVALYWRGRRDAAQRADLEASEAYRKTRERMDHEESKMDADPAAAREWLHDRSTRRGV